MHHTNPRFETNDAPLQLYIVLFFDPIDYYGHASGNAPARPHAGSSGGVDYKTRAIGPTPLSVPLLFRTQTCATQRRAVHRYGCELRNQFLASAQLNSPQLAPTRVPDSAQRRSATGPQPSRTRARMMHMRMHMSRGYRTSPTDYATHNTKSHAKSA